MYVLKNEIQYPETKKGIDILMADAGAWNGLYEVSSGELLVEEQGMGLFAGSGRGDGALGKGGEKEAVWRRRCREESGGL